MIDNIHRKRQKMINRRLARFLSRLLNRFRILKYFLLSTGYVSGRLIRIQPVLTVGEGKIAALGRVCIGCFPSPHFFSTYAHIEARQMSSSVVIGEGTQINNGFVLIAEQSSIEIGRNCLIGTMVEIYDSDFHALSKEDRDASVPHQCMPVRIEDNVFIGSNVKILKGVTIGEGAVIGNHSLITKDVPPCCIVAGNPAMPKRFLGQLFNLG